MKQSGNVFGTTADRHTAVVGKGADLKHASAVRPGGRATTSGNEAFCDLRLNSAGRISNCMLQFSNLKKSCKAHLSGNYRIQAIDLLENAPAPRDQILAIPPLVRGLPENLVGPDLHLGNS